MLVNFKTFTQMNVRFTFIDATCIFALVHTVRTSGEVNVAEGKIGAVLGPGAHIEQASFVSQLHPPSNDEGLSSDTFAYFLSCHKEVEQRVKTKGMKKRKRDKGKKSDRQRERQREWQTERQRHAEGDRQRQTERDRQTEREREVETDKQSKRQKDKQTETKRDSEKQRETERGRVWVGPL